jgi:hypothetical protein
MFIVQKSRSLHACRLVLLLHVFCTEVEKFACIPISSAVACSLYRSREVCMHANLFCCCMFIVQKSRSLHACRLVLLLHVCCTEVEKFGCMPISSAVAWMKKNRYLQSGSLMFFRHRTQWYSWRHSFLIRSFSDTLPKKRHLWIVVLQARSLQRLNCFLCGDSVSHAVVLEPSSSKAWVHRRVDSFIVLAPLPRPLGWMPVSILGTLPACSRIDGWLQWLQWRLGMVLWPLRLEKSIFRTQTFELGVRSTHPNFRHL